MLVHKQILIKGKVENTGFRFHALRGAIDFNIKGMVRQEGGDIIIEAEGEQDALDHFIAWCSKGTMFSGISSVQVVSKNIAGFSDFMIA